MDDRLLQIKMDLKRVRPGFVRELSEIGVSEMRFLRLLEMQILDGRIRNIREFEARVDYLLAHALARKNVPGVIKSNRIRVKPDNAILRDISIFGLVQYTLPRKRREECIGDLFEINHELLTRGKGRFYRYCALAFRAASILWAAIKFRTDEIFTRDTRRERDGPG